MNIIPNLDDLLQVEILGLDNDFLSALHLNAIFDPQKKYDIPSTMIYSKNISMLDKWNEFYELVIIYFLFIIVYTDFFARRDDIPTELKDIHNLTMFLGHRCEETFILFALIIFFRRCLIRESHHYNRK